MSLKLLLLSSLCGFPVVITKEILYLASDCHENQTLSSPILVVHTQTYKLIQSAFVFETCYFQKQA